VTSFERDGTQYLAFVAGGNALAASSHGDNLWLFSLDGTIGPAKPGGAGAGVGHAGEAPTTGDATAGMQVFVDNCSGCHGLSGTGANGGPTLVEQTDRKAVLRQVRDGGGGMPAFKGSLSEKEIQDVASYVTERIAKKRG
jgi:alcohol dehydrogenase (cytochrome c)